jgi:hypothetical protein
MHVVSASKYNAHTTHNTQHTTHNTQHAHSYGFAFKEHGFIRCI